ncbi:MAG: hypothetical protein K2I14_05305 [Eubacterium sp.]|nr:hypothetical protein [Eubacterium sp.]
MNIFTIPINQSDNSITFYFLNIDAKLTSQFGKFTECWMDAAIEPIFNVLFEKANSVFIANSAPELSNEDFSLLKKKGLMLNFDCLNFILKGENENAGIIGQQGENFIGISNTYLNSEKCTEEILFSVITHELVHYYDNIISGEVSFYDRLSEADKAQFDDAWKYIVTVISSTEQEEFAGYYFDKDDFEKLTYCVEAYVLALLCNSEELKSELSDSLMLMVRISQKYIQ